MSQKKASPADLDTPEVHRQLDRLYERRLIVDNLIRSLEEYAASRRPMARETTSRLPRSGHLRVA